MLIVLALPFWGELSAQNVALKNNLLYDATLTPNLSLEIGLGKKSTLDLGAGYNPFEFSDGKQWKHWMVQPEYRYWFCEKFNGTFIGAHLMGGQYSFAKVDMPMAVFSDLKDYRYEGYYYGGGFVVGYQWILGKKWSLELALGAGYLRVQYDKYPCAQCGQKLDSGFKNYFGPTKAAVSILFFL